MKDGKVEYWLFNTDETEEAGRGKHAKMLKRSCMAAWGYCKGFGAEATLNRPDPGDLAFFFRAEHGIIACGIVTGELSFKSRSIFGKDDEYDRPVIDLQVLPDNAPATVAEIKEYSGYQIPYRMITGRILNKDAIDYLLKRFKRISKAKRKPVVKGSGGGFSSDPAELRKIERSAVRFVTNLYKRKGWTVKSVERDKVAYDLHCTRKDETELVEVKGTKGNKQSFIVTTGEVGKAKANSNFVLYVVTNALGKPKATRYSASEFLNQFDLRAIQYLAKHKQDA